jgi:hypothetical protein
MEKLKPHLKAYQIKWLPSNDEAVVMGWMPQYVVSENEHLARKEALSLLHEHDISEDHFGNEFSYISLRLKRLPELDKFMIGNRVRSREEIDYDRKKDERDEEFKQMLSDNPNGYAYIRKGGYYYQPNHCGYTEYISYAGVYTIQEAVRACLGMSLSDYMRPILIDVDEHNQMINKQIDGLKTRLINLENHG